MANLKEIRNSIASVSSTKQITSAMKMVSAAKLRKAQDAVIKMRPYANKLQEVLSEVCGNLDNASENTLMKSREIKNVLIIIVTANRGMCGAFNSNVIKHSLSYAQENYPEQWAAGKVKFWGFGKKGDDFFKLKKLPMIGSDAHIFDNLHYESISRFADMFTDKYIAHEFDRIDIVYNRFKNTAVQTLTMEQVLPVPISKTKQNKTSRKFYIFEPNEEEIVHSLVPKMLKIQLFKALLDSIASEHGARMTAMHKATDNATEMIRMLKLNYNKARQASITNEILEIVSGANALKE
jgi:F-type H+-transporting ATPase subunit gamma